MNTSVLLLFVRGPQYAVPLVYTVFGIMPPILHGLQLLYLCFDFSEYPNNHAFYLYQFVLLEINWYPGYPEERNWAEGFMNSYEDLTNTYWTR